MGGHHLCVHVNDLADHYAALRERGLIRRGDALSMLFTVRAQHLRSHRGQISFPGGGRDEGDRDAVDNALREAQEEVGIDPARVEVIGYLDDYPTLTRYLVTPVVGLIEGEPELEIDENEVAEVFEAPLSFLLDPASFERKLLSRDGLNVPFFELNYGSYRIWGATASMLVTFRDLILHGKRVR